MIVTGKKFSKPEMSRVINGDRELAEVPEKPEKVRLDVLMGECYKSYNRSSLQKFIEFGFVTVNGEIAKKPNQKFERGVKIDLKIPETMKNADLVPEVIYEDKDVVVLNKPAGLLSMPRAQYCPEKTLENYGLLVHRLIVQPLCRSLLFVLQPYNQISYYRCGEDRFTDSTGFEAPNDVSGGCER